MAMSSALLRVPDTFSLLMNRLRTRQTRLALECHRESNVANYSKALGETASFIVPRMEHSPLRRPIESLLDLTRAMSSASPVLPRRLKKGNLAHPNKRSISP